MAQIILDPNKLAEVQPGFTPINTEIEFLRHADEPRLVIRGGLCSWAERYYQARGISVSYAVSRAGSIVRVCPGLSEAQAEAILQKFGDKIPDQPIQTLTDLLQKICPAPLWEEAPSIDHLARYFLWLWQNDLDDVLQPLIRAQAEIWEAQYAGPVPLPYHCAHDKTSALAALEEWVGIRPSDSWNLLGGFPRPVPTAIKNRAIEAWKREIITTKGQIFYQLRDRNVPYSLLRECARETAHYLIAHPDLLNETWVAHLVDYLSPELKAELREKVPPPVPADLPTDESRIPVWFVQQYLPYREWQIATNNEEAHRVVNRLARQFAEWYLETFPEMLLGHPLQPMLGFQKMSDLVQSQRPTITLILLLDGLNLSDARQLMTLIQEQIPKLKIVQNSTAYSVLPTVTSFCKEALIRGVPPRHTAETEIIGRLIPANRTPVSLLANAQKGEVYIWSILEPDETYHKYADKSVLQRNVESQLGSVVKKLSDVVDELPPNLPLSIIVTSDHGRLLTTSPRKLIIPEGMESHGRAAWGPTRVEFPASGYVMINNMVFLHAARFGLSEDVILPLDESTFLTSDGRSGNESYSHGGLYPEEVIVPWVELARDLVRPDIEITITGSGIAELNGTLTFTILNLGDDEIEVKSLEVFIPKAQSQKIELNWLMPAREQITRAIPVSWWPTQKQARSLAGELTVCDHQGVEYTYACNLTLEVEEMYTTDTPDIFADLQ